MRWFVVTTVVLISALYIGVMAVKRVPYTYYSHWMKGTGWNKYYQIPGWRSLYLASPKLDPVNPYKENYEELWRVFPLTNTQIPLPVRHPLYQTFPIIEHRKQKAFPTAGISIASSGGREIIRIYTVPPSFFRDFSLGQELFKLPYVRNRVTKVPMDTLWKDVFTKEITPASAPLDVMLYNLYIAHIRSKILPKETLRYGLNKNGSQVLIELVSKDKDYKVELVMHQRSGNVYSYLLRTAINNEESRKLRDKFLSTVDFTPADEAVGRILYQEFKQLNFARQVDQEGVQYLFSAWTQNMRSEELLKELIFYLERGRGNVQRLQPFYKFAISRYGKTFTTRAVMEDTDDPDVALQRKIEIEKAQEVLNLEKEKNKLPVEPELTPDERMNLYLKRAREQKRKDSKELIVH